MENAEIFYRLKYPKVDELSHMDNEIIGLLQGYEQHINQGQKLHIDSVSGLLFKCKEALEYLRDQARHWTDQGSLQEQNYFKEPLDRADKVIKMVNDR